MHRCQPARFRHEYIIGGSNETQGLDSDLRVVHNIETDSGIPQGDRHIEECSLAQKHHDCIVALHQHSSQVREGLRTSEGLTSTSHAHSRVVEGLWISVLYLGIQGHLAKNLAVQLRGTFKLNGDVENSMIEYAVIKLWIMFSSVCGSMSASWYSRPE